MPSGLRLGGATCVWYGACAADRGCHVFTQGVLASRFYVQNGARLETFFVSLQVFLRVVFRSYGNHSGIAATQPRIRSRQSAKAIKATRHMIRFSLSLSLYIYIYKYIYIYTRSLACVISGM